METKKIIEKLEIISDINDLSLEDIANKYLSSKENYDEFLQKYSDIFVYGPLYQLRVFPEYKKIMDVINYGNIMYPSKENENLAKKILNFMDYNIDKYKLYIDPNGGSYEGSIGTVEIEKDYASVLASAPLHSYTGQCTYCGHCKPCPADIDIAMVNKFYDLASSQKSVPESVLEHYKALSHTASECIGCKGCESRCPFGVEVAARMEKTAELFGC